MFLEVWLAEIERWSAWLGIIVFLLGGVVIGFWGWKWRRVLFFVASFCVVLSLATMVTSGSWQGENGTRFSFGEEKLWKPWGLIALVVALLVALWPRGERLGRLMLGVWLIVNFSLLLGRWVEEVELLRILMRIPREGWILGAVVGGLACMNRAVLQLVSALFGSFLWSIAYLNVLRYAGWGDSFFTHDSFVLFLFFLVTMGMYAFQGE